MERVRERGGRGGEGGRERVRGEGGREEGGREEGEYQRYI